MGLEEILKELGATIDGVEYGLDIVDEQCMLIMITICIILNTHLKINIIIICM